MMKPSDIRDLRTRLGWSQRRLAEYLQVDQSTVSTWEKKGASKGPAMLMLKQLAEGIEGAA